MFTSVRRKKRSFLVNRRLSRQVDHHSTELKFESAHTFHQIMLDLTFGSEDPAPGDVLPRCHPRFSGHSGVGVEHERSLAERGFDPTTLCDCYSFESRATR